MPAIAAIAKKHNLLVIEDCAQAFGSKGDTFKIGELSDAVCTSFITAKNLGTFGDGGAVFTNRDDIVEPIIKMRNHGSSKRSHHSVGWNSRLDDIQAAILSVKLKHIDEFNDARIKWAKLYDELLAGSKIKLPKGKAGYRHVYHLYVVETTVATISRSSLRTRASSRSPTTRSRSTSRKASRSAAARACLSRFLESPRAAIRSRFCRRREKNSAQCLSLPMYPELTEDEVRTVAAAVLEWENGPGAKYFA